MSTTVLEARARPAAHAPAARVVVALVLIALCWGAAFQVAKTAVEVVSPASLVAWRFAIATVVLAAARPGRLRGIRPGTALRGTGLGCLLGAGFLLQVWGLRTTSAGVSAFIIGAVVVLAPLAAWVWLRRRMPASTWLALALATAGLALLCLRGVALGPGEALTLAAAALWAVHLVALEVWARPGEVYTLTVVQLGVVAGLAAAVGAASGDGVAVPQQVSAWAALVGLGVVATGGAYLLLTWVQTRIDSTTSALILTLEPVFGAGVAVAVGGERLSPAFVLGAVAVLGAAVVTLGRRPVTDPPVGRSGSRGRLRAPAPFEQDRDPCPPPSASTSPSWPA